MCLTLINRLLKSNFQSTQSGHVCLLPSVISSGTTAYGAIRDRAWGVQFFFQQNSIRVVESGFAILRKFCNSTQYAEATVAAIVYDDGSQCRMCGKRQSPSSSHSHRGIEFRPEPRSLAMKTPTDSPFLGILP